VFEKRNVDTLSKPRPYDCSIDLVEGVQPPFNPIYNLSQDKLVALCEYFDDNFERGSFNIQSSSRCPYLLYKKERRFFAMCVNYRGLNQLTIKNWYLLPMILGLLD
jgi:hypothetical protein